MSNTAWMQQARKKYLGDGDQQGEDETYYRNGVVYKVNPDTSMGTGSAAAMDEEAPSSIRFEGEPGYAPSGAQSYSLPKELRKSEEGHTSAGARFLGGIGNAILHPRHPLGGRDDGVRVGDSVMEDPRGPRPMDEVPRPDSGTEEQPWRGSGVMPYSLPEELRKRGADDAPGQDSAGAAQPERRDGQVDPRYNRAADKYEQILREAPVKTKPKWYQQLAAAALGGAAGFSNSGGGHAHELFDPSAGIENILHPGYKHAMDVWNSRVGPSKEIMGVEAGRQKAEETAEQIAAQAEWRRSIGAQRRAQAAPHYNQTEVDAETGAAHGIQPDKDGKYYIPNSSVGQFTKPPKVEKTVKTLREFYDEAKAALPNAPEDQLRYYAMNKGSMAGYGGTLQNDRKTTNVLAPGAALVDENGKAIYTNPNRPLREPDALATELREQRLADMKEKGAEAVSGRKTTGQEKLLHERQSEIDGLLRRFQATSVEDLRGNAPAHTALAEINRRYAPQLQAVQDEYARAVRQRHGTADDFDVDPNTLEYKPRTVTPAPPPAVAAPPGGGGDRGGQPLRKFDKHGNAVELRNGQWVPIPRAR